VVSTFNKEQSIEIITKERCTYLPTEDMMKAIFFDQALDGMFATDEQGRLVQWNQAMQLMTGYAPHEVMGAPLWEVRAMLTVEERRNAGDIYGTKEDILAAMGSGQTGQYEKIQELKVRKKDGQRCLVELRSFAIQTEKGPGIGIVMRDISEKRESESKLKQQANLYQTIFHNTGTGTIIVEDDGTISMANEGFAKLSGFSKEEIEWRKNWQDFVLDADLERMREYHRMRRVDQSHVPHEYEFRLLDRKGRVHNAMLVVELIPNTLRSVASIIDVTEIREANETLMRMEKRTRGILDSIHDAFFSLDEEFRVTYFNDAAEQVLHKKRKEVIGMPLFKVFHEAKGSVFETMYRKAMLERETLHFETYFSVPPYENWYEVRVYPADRGISVYFQVTTERKRMEQALRESEKKYRVIVENAQEGIWVVDTEWRTEFVNDRMAGMLGLSPGDMVGRPVVDFMEGRSRQAVIARLEERKQGFQGINQYDLELLHRDGSRVFTTVRTSPLTDEGGKYLGVLGMVSDITDRKRFEVALKEANNKLNLLNSLTRHDLKNQLMVVKGHLVLAEKAELSDQVRTHLDKAIKASDNITRLLEFSKDYQGLGRDKPQWLNLTETCTLGLASFDTGRIQIELDLGEIEVFADKMLEKVFHNFASNSVKHGKRTTKLNVSHEYRNGTLAIIYEDDGVGLPQEIKQEIFGESRGYHGLYLAKDVLEMTGMSISEVGEFGKGARFEILVPKGCHRPARARSSAA
jgi:PAS domain S-box-containing protein